MVCVLGLYRRHIFIASFVSRANIKEEVNFLSVVVALVSDFVPGRANDQRIIQLIQRFLCLAFRGKL